VIPYDWVRSAVDRDIVEPVTARKVWGVDVARFGGDRTTVTQRTPRKAFMLAVWKDIDLMESASKIKDMYDKLPLSERPSTILVDDIGMGSGVLDRLRQLGLPARGVNVAESAAMKDKYSRARDELWWKAREWFQGKNVSLRPPKTDARDDPDAVLHSELVMPKYGYTETGKIRIEGKASMRRRVNFSPDVADSFIITFAEDLTNAHWGSTDTGAVGWNAPLRRNLSVV